MKRISQFTIKLNFTLSKLVGTVVVFAGLLIPDIESSDKVILVGIGAAMIGVKQYFTSKAFNSNVQESKEV